MDHVAEPAREPDADEAAEDAGLQPIGGILVAAALVFAAAVVASTTATAISVFSSPSTAPLVDQLHLAALHGVNLLSAGLLVGAALLLVAAEFHDVDSPWYPRALGIVGGLACIAVVAGVFVALDVPAWSREAETLGGVNLPSSDSTADRIALALVGLSVAAVAALAAGACRLLATGGIDFGRARSNAGVKGDDPQ